ncbi:hypothetical protein FXO38_08572 [Capsicum annuum]|nr:hypothetical protein FXO38_08572 [Capsicum annuum]
MYGSQLLATIGLDRNNNIFPMAYAIVEKECKDTWQCFLNYLTIDIEIEKQYVWTFMSNKQKGLLEAFEEVLSNVSHRFCARHLHNNFKANGFPSHAFKMAFWKASREKTVEAFNMHMLEICELDKKTYEWLLIYPLCESFKRRYRQIERAVLSGEIIGLNLRGAAVTREGFQEVDLSETVRMMEESIPQVILLLEAAVKRCINFTSGFEVDELILVLNDVTLQYISTLQENVEYKTLSLIVSRSSIDQNKPDIVKGNGTGQLLVARKVALEVSSLRLVDIPEKARKLLNLLEDSKDSSNDETNIGEVSKAMGEGDFVRDSLFVESSHQGDSGLIEVPVRAFHGAFHDKTKETGEVVSPSLELH